MEVLWRKSSKGGEMQKRRAEEIFNTVEEFWMSYSHLVGGSVVAIWTERECNYDDSSWPDLQKILAYMFSFQDFPWKMKERNSKTGEKVSTDFKGDL